MASFANAFWGGGDYAGGLGVLFAKLQQGVQENLQMLTIARMRAEAEELYGQRISEIDHATNRIPNGFQRDDGASTKKAYEGVRTEMAEAAKNHKKIASNIRELVVTPFGRWCDQHSLRVQNSQDDLQARVRAHDKQSEVVRQCRSQYYNKCRRVEDLDEEEKLAFQDPQNQLSPKVVPTVKVTEGEGEPEEEEEPVDLGDETYSPERLKQVIGHMLEQIRLGETKVPILGTYQNVSTGSDIVDYVQRNLNGTSVAYAERIGQDLIDNGFLRLVGNMGSTFANSSRMSYQWRPKAFKLTGIPEKRSPNRTSTIGSMSSEFDNPNVAAVSEYLQGWNPLNNPYPNETPSEKLRREARESDEKYKAAVKKLDALRCSLEEAMVDHFRFMERCELDRLKAIKSVILDFSGAISNVIPSLQSTVDNMMLFQETVQPAADLRWLLENYRNGSFSPKVQIYENYYNHVEDQIFGVDLEARARADRKRVPIIVTSLLMFLDEKYPELEGDKARRDIWLVDVSLNATHHLRNAMIAAKQPPFEILERYDMPIVASLLKLYLLELPDSLVSAHIYDIVKTIYTTTAQSTDEGTRISVIQSTLGQLRLANIATLDAITSHFTRLIELTSADETYIAGLAATLAPCFLRPKQENSLTVTERYNVKLVRDLFAHKDAIFGELKRATSVGSAQAGANKSRERHVSRDESHRREAMEERQRAIQASAAHMRAPSPNRLAMGHRRERSTNADTRFPINTASTSNSPITTRIRNGSLDVPSPDGQFPQSNGTSNPNQLQQPSNTSQPSRDPGQLDTRGRSATQGTAASDTSPIHLSSSLTYPGDFMSPTHYYTYTAEDSTSSNRNSVADSLPTQSTADQPSTQEQNGVPRHSSTSSISRHSNPVEKRDSLNRGGGAGARSSSKGPQFSRRTTSGLQRQSLVGKRDSVGSTASAGTTAQTVKGESAVEQQQQQQPEPPQREERASRGVELVDRPMDD